ncbi:molybdopterin molybdotransferase MoeA [Maliponia aquimaris]|uniref:Molybdopterin molybdenumtransferase n=1 Tax=Maliponia aquimaris TaxID=1673631 RepID=A0A238L0E0_9RHOB|nr:gephyrin-like molybdotransferase Glp [Maliponia aquimaris]SMX48427.1 Molybdopterin molybdenumtransferase [Maliponia aquimaris]
MITVAQALDQLFALARPLEAETVPLSAAAGRVLARPVTARRDQPPFPASAMDGYAVPQATPGARFTVIGESAAGSRFDGPVGPGQAVRIFTGAPVPQGATRIVIQEDTMREGDTITLRDTLDDNPYIRPAGTDFRIGDTVAAPRLLSSRDVALLAAMNIAEVPVTRKPRVALISTGDELVMPGDTPGPDQIIASNTFGLHALLRDIGAAPRILPIARDTAASLTHAFDLVEDADLVITIGGASVGDHDLVARVAAELGMERAFHKVAMRPGKPLMSGRLRDAMMIGLPGNPVSAMVCGHVFVAPVIRAMLGLGAAPAPRRRATLTAPLEPNGKREHYMRAQLTDDGIAALDRQDSSLLSVLGAANALLVRPVDDPARAIGEQVDYLPL